MSKYTLAFGIDDTNFEADMYPIASVAPGDTFDLGVDTGAVLTVRTISTDFVEQLITFVCDGDDGCTYERSFILSCYVEELDVWEFGSFYGFDQLIMEY